MVCRMSMQSAVDDFGGRRLVDTPTAARYLGVAVRTLECWRQRGGGPRYIRLAPAGNRAVRAVRYRLADLDRWIAEREVTSTSDPNPADAGPRRRAGRPQCD